MHGTLPHHILAPVLAATIAAAPLTAQTGEPIDEDAIALLREQGLEQSQVMELLSWICDVHGPRLTGSPNLRRAQQWAVETLASFGLQNAHTEEWGPFGMGWRLDHFHMDVIGDNPWPVHAWPKAWSPATDGLIEADVVLIAGLEAEAVEAMDLTDKIVLIEEPREVSEPFEAPAKRHDAESLLALADSRRATGLGPGDVSFARGFNRSRAVRQLVESKKPLAILDRSYKGDYGTIFVTSASVASPPGTPRAQRPRAWAPGDHHVIPQMTLAVEHYNRMCRLLRKGLPVRVAMELRTTFTDDDLMERNVIAEIPGGALRDQVVMLGAHFDSWHSGTGSTDNGAGSAVMMEAARLLQTLVDRRGTPPRRTIRIALWSGEEQGLLGSRAYVARHFGSAEEPTPAHSQISGYFNLDNGTGAIRGIYTQSNAAVMPIFRAWLRPFHDLDASTVTLDNTGGTDHRAFDSAGIPGFQFIQDRVAYSTRTHHSNMDNWDHAVAGDLRQAATIVAAFVWHTAQRDAPLPR